jgi:hypothetical protein
MMREYVKKMFAKEFDMNKVLKHLHTQKIYSDTSEGKIDLLKLETVLKTTLGLGFLLDPEKFGVQVVAFFIRRYQQTQLAFSCMQQDSKETIIDSKQTRCTKKNPHSGGGGGGGGGEVFRAFTTDGQCVLHEGLMGKLRELAATQSAKDYYRNTLNGRKFHNTVEEDLQPYLDAYYSGHKSRFKGNLYNDAKLHMEVYIKIMYYVQRGLIAPYELYTQKYVNAAWGEIGMFFPTTSI